MPNAIKTISSIDDIEDILLTGKGLSSSALGNYTAVKNKRNKPLYFPGGFCLSIKMTKSGSATKCLRCWSNPMVNQIPNFFQSLIEMAGCISRRSPRTRKYFADFRVYENVLTVTKNGVKVGIPGIVMDWVEGETLAEYLINPRHTSSEILALARKFTDMCSIFYNEGIAHGDISSSNIMILPGSQDIVLLDYDTLYFRENGRRREIIKGAAGYQHPGRANHPYQELYCDNFSHHIIYTSLLVYAANPSTRPKGDGMMNKFLLFEPEDLISASEFKLGDAYNTARSIGDKEINRELDIILKALEGPYSEVPNLIPMSVSKTVELAKPIESPNVMRFCTVCGAKYENINFKFCTTCGAKRSKLIEL